MILSSLLLLFLVERVFIPNVANEIGLFGRTFAGDGVVFLLVIRSMSKGSCSPRMCRIFASSAVALLMSPNCRFDRSAILLHSGERQPWRLVEI